MTASRHDSSARRKRWAYALLATIVLLVAVQLVLERMAQHRTGRCESMRFTDVLGQPGQVCVPVELLDPAPDQL